MGCVLHECPAACTHAAWIISPNTATQGVCCRLAATAQTESTSHTLPTGCRCIIGMLACDELRQVLLCSTVQQQLNKHGLLHVLPSALWWTWPCMDGKAPCEGGGCACAHNQQGGDRLVCDTCWIASP